MILRKPYAFLIKYFHLIHLILFGLILYIGIRSYDIVHFLNGYVASGYYTYSSNLAGSYINFFMYLAIIVIILATLLVYLLMKAKNKPTKLYVLTIAYYTVLMLIFTSAFNIFRNLEVDKVAATTVRAYRDLSIIISLPQLYYVLMFFIRGVGFDIKKFNFKKDLEELKVEAEDDEEFEVVVGQNNYKIKRTFRRTLRELRYYILENKFAVATIASIIVIVSGIMIYFSINVYGRVYKTGHTFAINNLQMTVKDAYLTNLQKDGRVLTKNKYYLVIKLNINNLMDRRVELVKNDYRLIINNHNYYPTQSKNEHFTDLGIPLKGVIIPKKTQKDYLLIYEISDQLLAKDYNVRIVNNISFKAGAISANYRALKISPKRIDKVNNSQQVKEKELLSLKDSNLLDSNILINNHLIQENYDYQYDFCVKENCIKSTNVVQADFRSNIKKTLLIINYSLKLDNTSFYYASIKSKKAFMKDFVTIEYKINGKTKLVKGANMTPSSLEDYFVYQVNREIKDAEKIKLLITIRDKKYTISLK